MAANPQAVLMAGSGTPAALPQRTLKERGYKGAIYLTHGVAHADFLRVVGADGEGRFLPAGPVLVAAQLAASDPSRKAGLDYTAAYEARFGKGSVSTFGAHAWDAGLVIAAAAAAATTTTALKQAKPGTPEFRAARRNALEATKEVVGTHGTFNMSPNDHNGLDQRARVMVKIEKGAWVYQK